MRCATWLVCLSVMAGAALSAENWPEHRGRSADGQSNATGLPLTWSETENVAWKTAIHDRGWSSPVVWKNQVWLTTAKEDGTQLFAVGVDRESGRIVHDVKVFDVEKPEKIADVNSYASCTPAVEEGRVYVHYGTYGTACLDTASGNVLWTRRDVNCDHHMGPGSSPILFENLVVFQMDGCDVQFVVALDKATGKTVWRTDRSVDYSRIHPYTRKSFGTPRVISVDDRLEMISTGSRAVMAYDPRTGTELWKVRYAGWSMVARPLFGHGLVYVVTDYERPQLYAIRPGGDGDVTDDRIIWKLSRGVPATPSLLLIDELLFMVTDLGVAACVEAKTGEVVWQKRLDSSYWASPVFVDGRIYFFSQRGVSHVIKPGREFEQLAVNELDGEIRASPAIAGRALFVRTEKHLYRIEDDGS